MRVGWSLCGWIILTDKYGSKTLLRYSRSVMSQPCTRTHSCVFSDGYENLSCDKAPEDSDSQIRQNTQNHVGRLVVIGDTTPHGLRVNQPTDLCFFFRWFRPNRQPLFIIHRDHSEKLHRRNYDPNHRIIAFKWEWIAFRKQQHLLHFLLWNLHDNLDFRSSNWG